MKIIYIIIMVMKWKPVGSKYQVWIGTDTPNQNEKNLEVEDEKIPLDTQYLK